MFALAAEPQPKPARGQDRESRAGGEQVDDEGRGVDDLLEIVEHEQEVLVAQEGREAGDERFVAGVAHVEDLGNGGGYVIRVADRRKRDEPNAIREGVSAHCGYRKGKAGLAHATRSGKGYYPRVAPKQPPHLTPLPLAADEWRRWYRHLPMRRLSNGCGTGPNYSG